MPIRVNGTTLITNRRNGTNITTETVNGILVYGGTGAVKEWGFYGYDTSEPPTSVIVNNYNSSVASTSTTYLDTAYPATNYTNGTIGAIYYATPEIYAVFVVRSV